MENHWWLLGCEVGLILLSWTVSAACLARRIGVKRAYAATEGMLLSITGFAHCVLLAVLLFVQLCLQPVSQDTLKLALVLDVAWNGSQFVGMLLVGRLYTRRGKVAFELFHHSMAVACALTCILAEMPIEMHVCIHFASLHHSWAGLYRYYIQWDNHAEVRHRWHARVTGAILAHDVSKFIISIAAVFHWMQWAELRWVDRIVVCAGSLLIAVVLVNHSANFLTQTRETEKDVAVSPGQLPASSAKVAIDTRAVHGLRGCCALYIALGHFIYYSDWEQEGDQVDLDERALENARVDLHGGWLVAFFYVISGFVMAIGYGQNRWRAPQGRSCLQRYSKRLIMALLGLSRRDLTEPEGSETQISNGEPAELRLFDGWGFIRKRFVRLAPLYVLTNALGVVLMVVFGTFVAMVEQYQAWRVAVWIGFAASGLTSWVPSSTTLPPNPSTWTISTMITFYVAFPVLIPYLQRVPAHFTDSCAWRMYFFRLSLIQLATVEVMIFDAKVVDAYWMMRAFPLFALPVFVMGCCSGFHIIEDVRRCQQHEAQASAAIDEDARTDARCLHRADRVGGMILFLLLLSATMRFFSEMAVLLRPIGELLCPLLYFELVKALTSHDSDKSLLVRLMRTRPAQFLGEISMGLYMSHWPMMQLISNLTFPSQDLLKLHQSPLMPRWATAALVPSSIVLGYATTQATEFISKHLSRCISWCASPKSLQPDIARERSNEMAEGSPAPSAHLPAILTRQSSEHHRKEKGVC